MSDVPKAQNVTSDSAIAAEISNISAEYDAACDASGEGGSPPAPETYLARVAAAHRETLRSVLEEILEKRKNRQTIREATTRATADLADETAKPETPSTHGGTIRDPRGSPQNGEEAPAPTILQTAAPRSDATPVDSKLLDADFSLNEQVRHASPALIHVPGYEIVGELGRGGMGVVYKARQVGLNRQVALKMVLAGVHAGPPQLARFQAEAEAVAGLQHPNIVQIYEVGRRDGLPYFSLEFVDGGSLLDKVHRQPQPPRDAAHLIETLARAMYYAHQRGIIHRDLKPANVLLTANGIPKITDFGLAKRLESSSGHTASGTIIGTPSYMAPEQAGGEIRKIGPAADIYALGAILYELLTGRPPFEAATAMETLRCVIDEEAAPPSRLQPNISADLETICLKCLQKDSGKRYGTAEQLAEDLRRFLSGEPILARPITGPERFWRWCKRNPRTGALAGSVALLLVLVTCVSTYSYFTIRAEKAATEEQRELAENSARLEKLQRGIAEAAEKKAQEQAKIAGEQRTLALNTLYGMITKFEEKLHDKEEMSDLRKELLEMAMQGLNQVSRSVENAALADRSMGLALQRVGDYYYQMGRTEEALKQVNLSLDIFRKLEREEPQNDWLPWNSAISYDALARITRELKGDPAAARNFLEKSMRLREKLLASPRSAGPPQAVRRDALVVSYDKLANLSDLIGDMTEAKNYALKALEPSQAILAANPGDFHAKQTLTNAYYYLGKVSAHRGDVAAGRKYFQKCLEMWQAFCKAEPTNGTAKMKLGWVYDVTGDLEAEYRRAKEALEFYLKGHDIHQAMYKKEPQNAELQWYLAYSNYRLATARRMGGDLAGAQKDDRESLSLRELLAKTDPNNFQRIEELMISRARCGNYREAARAAADLRKRAARDASVLVSVACCYGACIRAVHEKADGDGARSAQAADLCRTYTALAVDSVKQAVTLGYQDAFALEHHPDLESLQSDAHYKSVLAQLKQP
jgi:serine/threonine-protein kinase